MVVRDKQIPRKDLRYVLFLDYSWRSRFYNYTARKRDYWTWAEYEVMSELNKLGKVCLAIVFIPAVVYLFVIKSFCLLKEIVRDLAAEFNNVRQWANPEVEMYFE